MSGIIATRGSMPLSPPALFLVAWLRILPALAHEIAVWGRSRRICGSEKLADLLHAVDEEETRGHASTQMGSVPGIGFDAAA